jgi:hypothetical protein
MERLVHFGEWEYKYSKCDLGGVWELWAGGILQEERRASFSEQLSAPIAIESILGAAYQDEWWVDISYM